MKSKHFFTSKEMVSHVKDNLENGRKSLSAVHPTEKLISRGNNKAQQQENGQLSHKEDLRLQE